MRVRDDVRAGGATPCDHQVLFYESDRFLVESTVRFLSDALDQGGSAAAIATAEHLAAIEQALSADAATRSGTLVLLDAQATLDRFMVGSRPDPDAFAEVIGSVIDRFSPQVGQPHLFGEMVAVLWDQGNVTGALELEDLWNELARNRSFLLSCAYPIRAFDAEEDAAAFRSVCLKHSSVTPTEASTRQDPDRAVSRRREDELEASLQRLQELERVRAEFVSMVVHDIRTPAGVVSASLELLRDAWPSAEDQDTERILATAVESAERIHRLVDDLQLMSRLDSGAFSIHLRPGSLQPAVARAVSEVRSATGRSIELDLPYDLPPVLVDEDRQVQILNNLLSNAVKFSPPDTTVRLSVEEQEHQVVVRVHDRGVGIAADDQPRLFEPFSRLGTTTPGTGLGLYIARTLVEGQGGSIWVESTPEDGTTFSYSVVKSMSLG